MKLILISLIAVFAAMPATGEEFRVNAPVVAAKVHPFGGIVTRRIELEMPAGAHRILVPRGTSGTMSAPQFRISAGVNIVGIASLERALFPAADYYSDTQAALWSEAEALRDRMLRLENRIREVADAIEAAKAARAFITDIRAPKETAASVTELAEMADFISTGTADLGAEITARSIELRNLQEEKTELAKVLRDAEMRLGQLGLPQDGEDLMAIDVVAQAGGPAVLEIDALMRGLAWQFDYDVELIRGDAPRVLIDRNITLSQNTGFHWSEVAVTLTTARLNQQLAPTIAFPNQASIYSPELDDVRARADSSGLSASLKEAEPVMKAPVGFGGVLVTEGLAVRYEFPRPVSLANGSTAQLALDRLQLDADEFIQANPQRDTTAFLMAEVTNTSGAQVLASGATFRRDGELVGLDRMPQIAPGETATLAFGPHDAILLDLNFARNDTGDIGIIRSQNTRRQQVTFSVENLTDARQDVRTFYSLPFSEQEDLLIETTTSRAPDEMNHEGGRGVARWDMALGPGEMAEIELVFDFRWPEGWVLNWQR